MRRLFSVVVCVFLVVLPLYARSLYESSAALADARTHLAAGEIELALKDYREAISWNSPLNHFAKTAALELQTYARSIARDDETKLQAFEALKQGLVRQQSALDSPKTKAMLLETRADIAALYPAPPPQIQLLHPPRAPSVFHYVTQIAFILWIGSALLLIARGLTREGHCQWREIARYGSVTVLMYICWLLSLAVA